jgi:ABC-type branched-subunit amino acid transport system substrate-binding protein
MGDAVKAMIKWCNDQGGIEGRQVVGDFYDAAITQTPNVMQQACKSDFMLVGEGWALDDSAEQIRVGCNLVAVPGFSVGPNFANGPMMYQAVPNPDDYIPGAPYFQTAQLFPTQIKKADLLHTTLSATETSNAKAVEGMQAAGWNVLNCGVKINYTGEPDYKPFAQKFQSCGISLLFNNTGPGPVLYNFIQAMDQVGLHPIILGEANVYTAAMAQWNTAGLGNNIYVRESFQPLENAAQIPAVKAYLDAVKATGGDVSQLGAQSTSSFLLWATAAKSCGSNLTRQCMVNYLSKVHNWTGGGLHATGDPGANLPPKCGVLIKLTGTTWAQYYPKAVGTYDCNDKYLFKVSQANWGTTLGPDRIATKFLTPNLIKPQ